MRARFRDIVLNQKTKREETFYLVSALTNNISLSPKINFFQCNSSPARKPSVEQRKRNTPSNILVITLLSEVSSAAITRKISCSKADLLL